MNRLSATNTLNLRTGAYFQIQGNSMVWRKKSTKVYSPYKFDTVEFISGVKILEDFFENF